MEILYRSELCKDKIEDLLVEVSKREKITEENLSYLIRLLDEIKKNRKVIDRAIKENLKGWRFGRLHLLAKAIMRVATCELFFFPDVPPKVSIDEAVEIAKEYIDEAGKRFINGVLDAIYKKKVSGCDSA